MIFKKFQIEFLSRFKSLFNKNKTLLLPSEISNKGNEEIINVFEFSPSMEEQAKSLSIDSASIIYYRTSDKFLIYRVVSYSTSERFNLCNSDFSSFETIDDLKDFYKDSFKKVDFINLLSVDYVYLCKAGVYVEGQDLRTRNQILNDKVVHCLFTNGFLNEVLIHTNKLNNGFYRPFDGNYTRRNREGWSYELIDSYLRDSRMKMFLTSDSVFFYNKITKQMDSSPSELLVELECSCSSDGNKLNHCGDLGIQIS